LDSRHPTGLIHKTTSGGGANISDRKINPELWSELESWAQDELRSVNGQIEYILKQAVAKRKGGAGVAKASEPRKTDLEK
jgi:hypothetical protein